MRFADNQFSITELIEKVRELVEANQLTRYVKESRGHNSEYCSYKTGQSGDVGPGCLFGQILPWDVVDEDIRGTIHDILRDHVQLPNEQLYMARREADGDEDRTQELAWLSDVQESQDSGAKWADTVDSADRLHPLDN